MIILYIYCSNSMYIRCHFSLSILNSSFSLNPLHWDSFGILLGLVGFFEMSEILLDVW